MTDVSTDDKATASTVIQPAAAQQPTGIQISDLQSIMNIIDLASSRGAFRAPELSQVGMIADKLQAFLRQVASEQAKTKKEEDNKNKDSAKAPADKPADASADKKE